MRGLVVFKKPVLAGLALILVVAVVIGRQWGVDHANRRGPSAVVTVVHSEIAKTGTSPIEPLPNEASLAKLIPSRIEIREQVARRPREAPESLLKFTVLLTNRMQNAIGSPEASHHLMNELEDCVGPNNRGNLSVQAICLMNAERLAKTYPELKEQNESMKVKAGGDAKHILEEARTLGL